MIEWVKNKTAFWEECEKQVPTVIKRSMERERESLYECVMYVSSSRFSVRSSWHQPNDLSKGSEGKSRGSGYQSSI
jgi:hypothetical protein